MSVQDGGIAVFLTVAAVGIAGCSTLDVRGSTRSSAVVEGRQPHYGLGQGPQQRPRYDNGQAGADRYRPDNDEGRQTAAPYQTRSRYIGPGYDYRAPPVDRTSTGKHYGQPNQNAGQKQVAIQYYPQGSTAGRGDTRYVSAGDVATSERRQQQSQAAPQMSTQIRERKVASLPVSRIEPETRYRGETGRGVSTGAGQSDPPYTKFGWARWIGPSWRGHTTTSGEIFQPELLTGAHATLPLPSFVYVTNRANGRTVLIRVNDRVPHSDQQTIIVSQRAAELLDFLKAGRVMVDIQYAGPASPRPNGKHEEAFLQQQPWFERDFVRNGAAARARTATPDVTTGQRYPAPTYPRWDGTLRQ